MRNRSICLHEEGLEAGRGPGCRKPLDATLHYSFLFPMPRPLPYHGENLTDRPKANENRGEATFT